ncbi:MAG: hypothetical protein J6Z04_01250 [Clostridia bacterium]|nr:hypothetical protein [Clostridia bacterium]
MADEKLTREDCLALLRETWERLLREGFDRYPKRADFEEAQVVAIKAFLGPWPRALEAAGIKPPRNGDRLERNRQKRIAAKRRRNAERKNKTVPEDPENKE